MDEHAEVIAKAVNKLITQDKESAIQIIDSCYPFRKITVHHRAYTTNQKFMVFFRDGFIDRYTGEKLINPGVLKALSFYFPDKFPYHPHWKMQETHVAYWELVPTIDHIVPIAQGGKDNLENWVTTSMLHNQIKNNWSLEQLNWRLHTPGNIDQWNGLTKMFITLVRQNDELLQDKYIRLWYQTSKNGMS